MVAQLEVVGGYYPYYRYLPVEQYDVYNYHYYAFAFCTASGGVSLKSTINFDTWKDKTAAMGAKQLISVNTDGMSQMAADSLTRVHFADSLIQFCRAHELEGIDMDWEGIRNDSDRIHFTSLMKEIRSAIDSTDLEFVITVTYGNYAMQWYEDEALQQADFLQIMVYDQTGTWAQSPYGNHASMYHFQSAETYWVSRGYDRQKLVMGLPFYGYRFDDTSGGIGTSFTYDEVLQLFPDAKTSDNLLVNAQGYHWFNGYDLIQEKVWYARSQGFKGVFVWEVTQDAIDSPISLQKALVSSVGISEPKLKVLDFYPNPMLGEELYYQADEQVTYYEVFDLSGRLICAGKGPNGVLHLNVIKGSYLIRFVFQSGTSESRLLVKN